MNTFPSFPTLRRTGNSTILRTGQTDKCYNFIGASLGPTKKKAVYGDSSYDVGCFKTLYFKLNRISTRRKKFTDNVCHVIRMSYIFV